jgi:Ca2+-binding EF-hand superfamily protein
VLRQAKKVDRRRGSVVEVSRVQKSVATSSRERLVANKQIVELIETFEGMKSLQLKIVFDALDADRNGSLDRSEVQRLVAQVLGEDVPAALVEATFDDMDADHSGTVEFDEFVAFFGVSRELAASTSATVRAPRALHAASLRVAPLCTPGCRA